MALSLIQLFEDKEPRYPSIYKELIRLVSTFHGERSVERRNKEGRAFSNGYEVFIYAAILGMKRGESISTKDLKKEDFSIKLGKWHPIEMTRFLLISVIAKSPNIDLLALESMAEEEVKAQINNLVNLLEQYACGGFNIMQNAIQQNPDYYRQEDFFLQLLM